MDHFRRSVIRLLVGTIFLLFIAWVGVKLMQYGGDYEKLLLDGRKMVEGWGVDISSVFDKVKAFAQSLIEKIGLAK